jgi:hypothetical protein
MDFLTSLAVRAMDPKDRRLLVRPRLVSFFEHRLDVPADVPPAGLHEEFVESETETPAAARPASPPEVRPREGRPGPPWTDAMVHQAEAAFTQHAIETVKPSPRGIPATLPDSPPVETERQAQPAPVRQEYAAQPAARIPAPPLSRPPAEPPRPAPRTETPDQPRNLAQSLPAVEFAAKPIPAIERIIRHDLVRELSKPVSAPASEPRRNRRGRERIPDAANTPPVSIEVTIGRVEVRAVAPPAPPKSQGVHRPPPALSLDDYLKQRNGGRS